MKVCLIRVFGLGGGLEEFIVYAYGDDEITLRESALGSITRYDRDICELPGSSAEFEFEHSVGWMIRGGAAFGDGRYPGEWYYSITLGRSSSVL